MKNCRLASSLLFLRIQVDLSRHLPIRFFCFCAVSWTILEAELELLVKIVEKLNLQKMLCRPEWVVDKHHQTNNSYCLDMMRS